jgi:hypothetical protein
VVPAGSSGSSSGRRARAGLVVAVLVLLSMVVTVAPASAAVAVSRAELSGTSLRIEGTATASRDITVDGVVMGRSDSGGRFRIERTGYTAPADCTVDVNDGSATPRVATLSGCTVSTPPPPPPSGPAAPTLLAPANGAGVTTPVTLSWSATIDPNPASFNGGYNWQLSASSTFGSLVTADSTAPSQTTDTVGGLVTGTYFWRVQAVDGALNVSAWSAARSFVVTGAGTGALAAPVLAPLVDGGLYHPMEHFPFTWTAVPGAAEYLVEAARSASFSPVDIRIDNVEGTSNGLTMHSSLIGTWNLRVRAVDADGVVGAASNVRPFSVSYDAPIGPPPVPLSPAEGATVSLPFVLDWEDVSNPQSSGYVVEIARDPGFDDVEALSTGLTNSQWSILGLSSGTKYWRVQHAEGDSSPTTAAFTAPSAVRSFTVSGQAALASVRLLDTPTAYSGTERLLEIQLTALAPAGGAVVALTSSNPSAVPVPETVTVPAGQSLQQVRIVHGQVTAPTEATVTATYAGSTATTSITVLPSALKQLGAPTGNSVTGGTPASVFVELEGAAPPEGAVVSVTSSSPLATPPATVTVPAGAFLQFFSIPTSQVTASTPVTITASWRGGQVSRQLVLEPGVPPATWTIDRTTTTGSEGANARVSVDPVRTTDTSFTVTSSNPAVAWTVPTVTVFAHSAAANVLVQTSNPAAPTTVTLSVSGAGVTRTVQLTVNPLASPPPTALPAPSLLSPASGARFDAGRSIPFDWSNVTGAATYTLQVGTTTAFTTVVLTRTVTASQVSAAVTSVGDRFWRVRANSSDGTPGTWSGARSIRIR